MITPVITAELAPHHVRLVRHLPDSAAPPVLVDETVLMLHGLADAIRDIRSVRVGDYRIWMDWPALRLNHAIPGTPAGRQSHADPMTLIEAEGMVHLPLFLDRFPLDQARRGPVIIRHGETEMALETLLSADTANPALLDSWITRNAPGDWVLSISAQVSVEVIMQTVRNGQSIEEWQLLEAGTHHLPIPPFAGEYGGIAISTAGEKVGGVEHKHRLFGDLMAGTGRWFWDGQVLTAPRTAHINGWRALLASSDAPPPGDWDEVEILDFTPPALVDLPDWLADAENQRLAAPWLGASGAFAMGQQDMAEHGVMFCQPPEAGLPLPQARTHDQRRRIMPKSPCAACPVVQICDNLLPLPFSTHASAQLPFIDGPLCDLQAVLLEMEAD